MIRIMHQVAKLLGGISFLGASETQWKRSKIIWSCRNQDSRNQYDIFIGPSKIMVMKEAAQTIS